jgi:hypothetical protein
MSEVQDQTIRNKNLPDEDDVSLFRILTGSCASFKIYGIKISTLVRRLIAISTIPLCLQIKAHIDKLAPAVLKLIFEGHSSAEIVGIFVLSIHTVNSYRDSIMLKLEAKNAASLIVIALKSRLID